MTEQDLSKKPEIKTCPPSLHIIKMTEEEAFNYCKEIKAKADKWDKLGYPISTPNEFKPYFNDQMQELEFAKKFKKWFASWNIDKEVKQLQDCGPTFQAGVTRYLLLQKWGFEIPDQYNVVVTPCSIGAGGAGERHSKWGPIITMYYGRDWTKPRNRTPEETLLHEAYHLGIDGIIDELGFDQNTREKVVDVCSQQVLVPDILPKTLVQNSKIIMSIDPFLRLTNLPVRERLQQYKANMGATK